MARYTGTVTSPRPPGEVFEYLARFDRVAEWDPGVDEARALDPGRAREGARYEVVARFLGRDVPLVYRIVELDRPRRVVLRAETGTVSSEDTIAVEPGPDGGSVVTYDADLRLKGPYRAAELPMRLAFKRVGDRARDGLAEVLS